MLGRDRVARARQWGASYSHFLSRTPANCSARSDSIPSPKASNDSTLVRQIPDVQQLHPRIILRAMINPSITRQKSEDTGFLDRLRAATELLESIVADRGLLSQASLDDRRRLLQAAGHVYAPDAAARRQLVRASIRRRKAERVKREDTVLDQTGIRTLRRQPVFTSPNVFPPRGLRAAGGRGRSGLSRDARAAALLRLQAEVRGHPSLLRPAVPAVRRVQLRQAHRAGRPARAAWRC